MDWARKPIVQQDRKGMSFNSKMMGAITEKRQMEKVTRVKRGYKEYTRKQQVLIQDKEMEEENGEMQERSSTEDETLVLNMEDKWKELMDLSVTVTTFEDLKVDHMREVFFNTGRSFVTVNKIGFASFLVIIVDKEYEKELNWNDVSMWDSLYCSK